MWQFRQPETAKSLRAGDRLRVVREPFLLRPGRDVPDDLRAERLLRRRALVGQHAHRDDGEDRGDQRDRAPQRAAAPRGVSMNGIATSSDQADRRDADRAEEHRLRPLEDPEQVEEEVEVPVGPRNEADRARVGGIVEQLAEPARLTAVLGCPHDRDPVWSPGVVHFQITASPMITLTTTSDMIVSWSIAYG